MSDVKFTIVIKKGWFIFLCIVLTIYCILSIATDIYQAKEEQTVRHFEELNDKKRLEREIARLTGYKEALTENIEHLNQESEELHKKLKPLREELRKDKQQICEQR